LNQKITKNCTAAWLKRFSVGCPALKNIKMMFAGWWPCLLCLFRMAISVEQRIFWVDDLISQTKAG